MNTAKNNFKSITVTVNYGPMWNKLILSGLTNSPSGLLTKTGRVTFPRGEDKSGKAYPISVSIEGVNGKTITLNKGTTACYLPNGLSAIFTVKGARAQWHGEIAVQIEVAIGEDDEVNERLQLLADYEEIKQDIKAVFAESSLKEKIQKAKTALIPFNRA